MAALDAVFLFPLEVHTSVCLCLSCFELVGKGIKCAVLTLLEDVNQSSQWVKAGFK